MKTDFNYHSVPQNFLHCLNKECKLSAECLRYQVALRIDPKRVSVPVLSPVYISNEKECSHYMPDRLERFALGITHLLDELPHNEAIAIKEQLVNHFNRSTYYRCLRKERLISPEEQAFIRRIFESRGITKEPVFDEYVE